MRKRLGWVLAFSCIASRLLAWGAEGHMVVAQIAYNHLDPAAKAACDALIAVPLSYSSSRSSTFVTGACWADDYKSQLGTGIWHYIDLPFSLDGTSTDGVGEASFDVVRAIRQSISTLQSTTETQANKATSLRYLIHFAGDIHQPMHSSTAVSSEHPDGDAGGNYFYLDGTWSNMHSLWDAGGGLFSDSISRPLTESGQSIIDNKVSAIESDFPYNPNPGNVPDPMVWAEEGKQVSQTISYVGITQNTTPSSTYLNKAQITSEERAASAGHRLADLLNTLFAPPASADLSLAGSATPNPVNVGEALVYSIVASNLGPDTATDVLIIDTLPLSVDLLSSYTSKGSVSQAGNSVVCDLGSLASGTSSVLTIMVRPTTLGIITNVAAISAVTDDPVTNNNTVVTDTIVTRTLSGIWSDDGFETDVTNLTPGGTTGWTPLGENTPGRIVPDYDSVNTALRVQVSAATDGSPRISGWMTANSEWLPYTSVGTSHYVRGKFYVFRAGQADPDDGNQIPNVRVRLATRFAVNSMLEVFNHLSTDPAGTSAGRELRPSADPGSPSVYRVDLDPIDVAALTTSTEGVLRGFEAYCLEDQENGSIELAESMIGTYPAAALPDSGPDVRSFRAFAASASDAGDLKVFNSAADGPIRRKFTLVAPGIVGSEVALDGVTDPVYTDNSGGVTFDSTLVVSDRVGLLTREFSAVGVNTDRIRVEPGRQYKLRWHVTSDTNANLQPQMRLRARALKFMWSQKMEIGGALSGGTQSNAIAAQALPGVGTGNPDQQTPGENGGWYTLIMHTPMSTEIQPAQPFIAAQPGPGAPADSMRDIKFGFDMVDTLGGSSAARLESGRFTLDRVEIRGYDLVPD